MRLAALAAGTVPAAAVAALLAALLASGVGAHPALGARLATGVSAHPPVEARLATGVGAHPAVDARPATNVAAHPALGARLATNVAAHQALEPRPAPPDDRTVASTAHGAMAHAPSADAAIYLPVTLRRADADDLPVPQPVPTASPTATSTTEPTPSPTATSTPGPSPTPLPPLCDVPLAGRATTVPVPVEGTIRTGTSGTWTRIPIFTAARDDGSAIVGWSAGSEVRFTPLGADGERAGPDLALPGESVHGLVAHEDGGGAVLIARPDDMVIVRFDADGQLLFEKTLVGTRPRSEVGAKWIDSWGYEGRLVWTGTAYAAYFGHTQWFGADGKHQGDLLWLFDELGEQIPLEQAGNYPTWGWGCSHSLDVRLGLNRRSDLIAPVCLSDGHPGGGFFLNNRVRIGAPVWADGGGRANGRLGGVAPIGHGFAITYGTETDRRSYDVALTLVSEYGATLADYWLTDTPSIDEDGPHVATYGPHLLAGWLTRGSLVLAVVDVDGNMVEGPTTGSTGVEIAARDDFVNFPGGAVGWTYVGADKRTLQHVRVPYCR